MNMCIFFQVERSFDLSRVLKCVFFFQLEKKHVCLFCGLWMYFIEFLVNST
ncbi:hypothetical protein BHE74_00055899 [Ensete ventricosum]|nr:hypothetical protein BHE74_00055899 [Ensete ventricosum]